jgi:gamma-glutamyltranspeptidase/glutathione hydrolase
LKQRKSRKQAIMAANDRFYKGDIAREFVRGCKEQGGLITMQDLAKWKPVEEEPLKVNYKGIDVYKLQQWTQGPMLLQALNILENFDLKKMGYNSTAYIHTIYQAMNLSFADRDFYYGDPNFPPEEPIKGLLSKDYAKSRAAQISPGKNDANAGPGDPYPFEGKQNPWVNLLKQRATYTDTSIKQPGGAVPKHDQNTNNYKKISDNNQAVAEAVLMDNGSSQFSGSLEDAAYHDRLWRGTTSVEAADKNGWVVSITPSGGWMPAVIAGNTGIGMSQRMQSFVLDSTINPFNVMEPGKRPRVTLTPTMALKDGKPFLSFAVQGGDTQDQNLLQFFLNMVEFNMTVQQACEAQNINSEQLWLSLGGSKLGDRLPKPGFILLSDKTPESIRNELKQMGYTLSFGDRTSGPINAIFFDWKHGSFWGGSSNNGEDYGIGW